MITLPSLNNLPSKWDEIRHCLEPRVFECGVMPYPNLTEHEAKQFEQDFIDRIGCAPEEYIRIRRAIRLLEARYPDSPNELTTAAIATPLGEMFGGVRQQGACVCWSLSDRSIWNRKLPPSKKPYADGLCFGRMSGRNFCGRNWICIFQCRLKTFATLLE
ncbi:unnamed protein product [Neisseria lactamica Y92-1009]|nr:unnamed protein product [Neisseria lactamica Y92-1009]